ncbi:MAG: DUF6690 family protein [Planctomycetaceae bacterium]
MRFLPAIMVFGGGAAAYVLTHEELSKHVPVSNWVSYEDATALSPDSEFDRRATVAPDQTAAAPDAQPMTFAQVFRFDLSPQSVTQRWPRVSTGLTDVRYQGYRVPLVTGSESGDLAGSLTYYFDSHPRLRRISFLGTTDEPARIVDFVMREFGMKRYNDGNARITTYRARYPYNGSLRIAPAEVLDQRFAATNYRLELLLER